MRILFQLIVYDILLAGVHLGLDIILVYSYFHGDDPWWAGVTITAICLPGLLGNYRRLSLTFTIDLEMMVIIYMYLHAFCNLL